MRRRTRKRQTPLLLLIAMLWAAMLTVLVAVGRHFH
jgi:hypothetical protein